MAADRVDLVRGMFFEETGQHGVVIPAYCFMPDHVHLVVSGREENADLVRCVKRSRQRSGFALRKETGGRLWQDGYYEHILGRLFDVLECLQERSGRDEDALLGLTGE